MTEEDLRGTGIEMNVSINHFNNTYNITGNDNVDNKNPAELRQARVRSSLRLHTALNEIFKIFFHSKSVCFVKSRME